MPVLREHDVREACSQAIDQRDNLIASWNRQGAAWAEVVLNIYDQQHIAAARRDRFCQRCGLPKTLSASRGRRVLQATPCRIEQAREKRETRERRVNTLPGKAGTDDAISTFSQRAVRRVEWNSVEKGTAEVKRR